MALPPSALDQLTREPVRTPGWSGTLLLFSSTLFILSLLAYVGLAYGYRPYLEEQVRELTREREGAGRQVSKEDMENITAFYSQLSNLDAVLAKHVYPSKAFSFLERNTHPNVYFTQMNVDTELGKMTLAGVARSVEDVSKQIQLFDATNEVIQATFSNVASAPAGWQFDASLQFEPAFWSAREEAASFASEPAVPPSASTTSAQ